MVLNHIQERLIDELIGHAKMKYPEVSLREIAESPGGSEQILVTVDGIDWNDDDKVMDFTEYLSEKQTDILLDYGYSISVMPLPATTL
jgi:hypothetical protein